MKNITLRSLLYIGFDSGMHWQTLRFWSKEHNPYAYRSLLNAEYTRPLVKGLVQASKRGGEGIPNLRKDTICDLFTNIWVTAGDNVELCEEKSPKEFFIECKNLFPQANTIPGDAFFDFTMRAFHARNIFKELYEDEMEYSTGTSMSEALDYFMKTFSKQYNIKYGLEELESGKKLDPARLREIFAVRDKGLRLREIYLPMALVGGEYQGYGDCKIYLDYEYAPPTKDNSPDVPIQSEDYLEGRSDDEETRPWRNLAGVISDDDDDDDFEQWEEDFVERLEDEDVTMGDPQQDAQMGGLAGRLELDQSQDQMELDE
ncbi:hypothetical protein PG990_002832 [Apiospora arundinis]